MTFGIAVLLTVQTAVGMVVNLYVTVPLHHPGAHPANYVSGSLRSLAWAVGHGTPALDIHASLGLVIVAIAIWVAIRAVALRSGWVGTTSVLAAGLIIGAGFNGASFLDFNNNVNSLLMALLALGATSCYLVVLYLLPGRRYHQPRRVGGPRRSPDPHNAESRGAGALAPERGRSLP